MLQLRSHILSRRNLLARNLTIIAHTEDGKALNSAFINSCSRFGDIDLVKRLVPKDTCLEQLALDEAYPLHNASYEGHVSIVKYLVDNKSNLDVRDNKLYTPLHHASREGKLDIVKILIEHGADIEAKDNNNWNAMQWAKLRKHTSIVQYLSEKGLDINIPINPSMSIKYDEAIVMRNKKIEEAFALIGRIPYNIITYMPHLFLAYIILKNTGISVTVS